MKSPQKNLSINASHISRQSILAKILGKLIDNCHDLAKQLSHYLYFFSFSFSLDLQLQGGAWESIT